MLKKICPCLSWFTGESSSELPRKAGYQPEHEFQQEQFMHHLEAQAKKSKQSNQLMSEQIPIEKQLEQTLGQIQQKQPQTYIVPPPKRKHQKKQVTQTHQTRQPEPQQSTKAEQQQTQKSYGFTNLGELQVNIPEYGPNYQLLKQKSHNAADLLDVSKNCTQVPLSTGKSQQQSKLSINKSQLRVWKTALNYSFIIQYQIPCSYAYYNEISNKKIQPKDNNKLIRQYKLIESIHQNLTLRYICFNKIGMLEPRDFTYLKYTNMSKTNPSGHWELCISKDGQVQANSAVKSGKLFSVSYIIQQHKPNTQQSEQRKGIKVRIRTYISLEINASVDKVWERILKQMKQYIQELWEEAESNYSQELV